MSYKAQIQYAYGSGKANTSTSVLATNLKGNTESAVMQYLRERHKNIKDLQILIKKIDWK
jgi:hypothetical protein